MRNKPTPKGRPHLKPRKAGRTRTAAAPVVGAGQVTLGSVVGVVDVQTATVKLPDGRQVGARLPQHVSPAWLREALEVGPVAAGIGLVGSSALLWCLYPGPEHAAVVADIELVGRNVTVRAESSAQLESPGAMLHLDSEGKATLRGREVLSRASGVHRIKGGSVRIN